MWLDLTFSSQWLKNSSKLWSSQLWTQFKQLRIEAWKSTSIRNCLNCVHYCDDHSSLDFKSAVQYKKHFICLFKTFISVILTPLRLVRIAIQMKNKIPQFSTIMKLEEQDFSSLTNHKKTEHDLSDLLQFSEIVVLTSNYHLHELLRMKEFLSATTMPLTRWKKNIAILPLLSSIARFLRWDFNMTAYANH